MDELNGSIKCPLDGAMSVQLGRTCPDINDFGHKLFRGLKPEPGPSPRVRKVTLAVLFITALLGGPGIDLLSDNAWFRFWYLRSE